MDHETRYAQAKALYEAGLQKVATTPPPEGQKYAPGTRVTILDTPATVLYTHAHAYGGDAVKAYCLDVDGYGMSAWHHENELMPIES